MKIKNLKIVGKMLTQKEQKAIKGGRGCGCYGDNSGGSSEGYRCHEC